MRKAALLAVVLLSLVGGAPVRPASAAPASSPLFLAQTFRNVATPARYFTLIQQTSEYAPGTSTATTTIQAPRFITVIEGELTIQVGDKAEVYVAGKGAVVPPGITLRNSNQGSKSARLVVSALLPAWAGALETVPGSVPDRPQRVIANHRLAVTEAPAVVDLVHEGAELDPGFSFPIHVMNHPHIITILSGEITFPYLDGGIEKFKAGEQAVMHVGRPGTMANEGQEKASYDMTWLAIPGTPLTSPVTAPVPAAAIRPPSTGDAGLLASGDAALTGWAYMGVLAGGVALLLVRRRARA